MTATTLDTRDDLHRKYGAALEDVVQRADLLQQHFVAGSRVVEESPRMNARFGGWTLDDWDLAAKGASDRWLTNGLRQTGSHEL